MWQNGQILNVFCKTRSQKGPWWVPDNCNGHWRRQWCSFALIHACIRLHMSRELPSPVASASISTSASKKKGRDRLASRLLLACHVQTAYGLYRQSLCNCAHIIRSTTFISCVGLFDDSTGFRGWGPGRCSLCCKVLKYLKYLNTI